MVDIKGLDKARVLKALYDNGRVEIVSDRTVTVEYCAELLRKKTSFDYLRGRVIMVNLLGDAFDERMYDLSCGAGTAQRAVDSVRAEQKTGPDTAGNAGDEKKELSMEEKLKQTKEAIEKILSILTELPPDMCAIASTCLKMMLPGKGIMRMPFSPPFPFESWF